jgi:indolepyruvate ferredoxin oxidoreductase
MNAPLTREQLAALAAVTLQDRYALQDGRAFMSGVQALVKLPMLQQARDAAAGHRTAGFISGYRGSPLGTYDQALWEAAPFLRQHDIVFQPGVNEELAASAVWGSQQLEFDRASRKFDGVFGLWYAKGPGVDRSSDALKHANLSGTAPLGGVLAIAGDDHVSKSSTLAHQSDPALISCGIPVFTPADVQDILDLGVHALALSRHTGLWAGMKTVQEVVESGATVDVATGRVRIVLPDARADVHIRWPDDPLAQEARMVDVKWPAALDYVRANRLNRNVLQGPHDRLGIVATGKAWGDTRQALFDLGLRCSTWASTTKPAAASASACTRSTWCGRWNRRACASSRWGCARCWWWRRSGRSWSSRSRSSSTTRPRSSARACWARPPASRTAMRAPSGCCDPRPTSRRR